MKTKDAFAFRDFDEKRILQRPFFKGFHFAADKSDAEILQDLSYADSDSIEILLQKFDMLDDLLTTAAKYQKHIKRHGDRLTKYARRLESKAISDEDANIARLREMHKRADKLSMDYCGIVTAEGVISRYGFTGIAVDDIGGLCQRIAERYKDVDERIKRHYTNIFAERLKFARIAKNMTQEKLAIILKITQKAVSNYEKGLREPSFALLVKISQKLNRPVGWFLGAE